MNNNSLHEIIKGCKNKDRSSQKALFVLMYDYGMSIAARYSNNNQDKEEIANDAFFKMLNKIETYKEEIPFKLWLRKIVINTGIDFIRKNKMKYTGIDSASLVAAKNTASENLDQEYLLAMLDRLSPQYRLVFVLHVIEGYTHDEIAQELGISRGTSKSNLFKARNKLKQFLVDLEKKEKYVGPATR